MRTRSESARAGTIAVSCSGGPPLERRRAHRHAVGVGRGHRQHAVCELDEDAGEHGARVVARRRPEHALRSLEERLARDVEGALVIDLGEPRKVVGVVGVQRVAARAALQLQQARPRPRTASTFWGGRWRTMSSSSRPGHDDAARLVHLGRGDLRAPRAPCRSPSAAPAARRTAASIRTPERICTLERCDTPRDTT